jgi:dihydrofolate synthase/folylpolyglutamate synthase
VIIDAAHNVEGLMQVVDQLHGAYPDSTYHIILGFVNDKDISGMLKLLPVNSMYYFTNAHIPRALPHHELKDMAVAAGLKGNSYDDVNMALAAAKTVAGKDDVIVICGSFFILAELH